MLNRGHGAASPRLPSNGAPASSFRLRLLRPEQRIGTMLATLHLDTGFHVGEIDRRIFGGFIEHLGRAVYGGIYDPGSPLSDERGFRRDVLEALRGLRLPVVRYPGGELREQLRLA
jgi:hypothetical protein